MCILVHLSPDPIPQKPSRVGIAILFLQSAQKHVGGFFGLQIERNDNQLCIWIELPILLMDLAEAYAGVNLFHNVSV